MNWKKLYRLYKEERLMVSKYGGRKRELGTRAPMAIPQDANQRWSLDFVSDNGTELTSNAVLAWQEERQVEWHYIAPGKRCKTVWRRASSGGS